MNQKISRSVEEKKNRRKIENNLMGFQKKCGVKKDG